MYVIIQANNPDSLIFLFGDFNHISPSLSLSLVLWLLSFTHFVDCPIRGKITLEAMNAYVKDAYRYILLPPLGGSDHNLVHLSSLYTLVVKKIPVITWTEKCWSQEAEISIQTCFEVIDWCVLCESHGDDKEGLTDYITDYIRFCADTMVPSREIKCFLNNKPLVTSSLKSLQNLKKKSLQGWSYGESKGTEQGLRRGRRSTGRNLNSNYSLVTCCHLQDLRLEVMRFSHQVVTQVVRVGCTRRVCGAVKTEILN